MAENCPIDEENRLVDCVGYCNDWSVMLLLALESPMIEWDCLCRFGRDYVVNLYVAGEGERNSFLGDGEVLLWGNGLLEKFWLFIPDNFSGNDGDTLKLLWSILL